MTKRKTQQAPDPRHRCRRIIGFHTATRLLERGERVIGLDNVNDYYDVRLKKARLAKLKPFKSFSFTKLDLANRAGMKKLFAKQPIRRVVHLAAQAGVRYSLVNPHAYTDSNIEGFLNILEGCRHAKVEHLVYASSSSVYGGNTQMPFSIHDNVDHPVSLYAARRKPMNAWPIAMPIFIGFPAQVCGFLRSMGPGEGPTWPSSSSRRRFLRENRSRSTTRERCAGTLPMSMTSSKE